MGQVFIAEYCNKSRKPLHKTVTTVQDKPADDCQLVDQVRCTMAKSGYEVYALWELLGGGTLEAHEELYKTNPKEAQKRVRMIFFDSRLCDSVH